MSHSSSESSQSSFTRKPTRQVPTPVADPPLLYDPTTKKPSSSSPSDLTEHPTDKSDDSLYSTSSGPPVYVHTEVPDDVSPAQSLRYSALAEEDEVFASSKPAFLHTSPSWSSKSSLRSASATKPKPPPPRPKPRLFDGNGSLSKSTSKFLLRRDKPSNEHSQSKSQSKSKSLFSVAGKNMSSSHVPPNKTFKIKAFNSSTLSKASTTNVCPSCGEYNNSQNFCQYCGMSMTKKINDQSESSFREEDDNDAKAKQHDPPSAVVHRLSNSLPKRSSPGPGPVPPPPRRSPAAGPDDTTRSTSVSVTRTRGAAFSLSSNVSSDSSSSASSNRSSSEEEAAAAASVGDEEEVLHVSYKANPPPASADSDDDDADDGRPGHERDMTMMDTIMLRAKEHVQSVNQNAQTGLGKIHTMSSTIKHNAMMNLVSNARSKIWETVGKKSVPTLDAALTEMFNPPEELPTPDFNVQTRPSPKPAPVKKVKDARVSFGTSKGGSNTSSTSSSPRAPPAAPKPKGVVLPPGAQPVFHVLRQQQQPSSPSAANSSTSASSSGAPTPPPKKKAPFAGAQSIFPDPRGNSSTPSPKASTPMDARGRSREPVQRGSVKVHKPTGLKHPPPRKRGNSLPANKPPRRRKSLRRPRVPLQPKKPTTPKPSSLRGTRKAPQPPKSPRPASRSAPGPGPVGPRPLPGLKKDPPSSSFGISVSGFSTVTSAVPKPPPKKSSPLSASSLAKGKEDSSGNTPTSPRSKGSLSTIMKRINLFKSAQKADNTYVPRSSAPVFGERSMLQTVLVKSAAKQKKDQTSGGGTSGISPSYASGSKTLGRTQGRGAVARAMDYEKRLRAASDTTVDDGNIGKSDIEHLTIDRPSTVKRNRPAAKKFVPSETINNIKL